MPLPRMLTVTLALAVFMLAGCGGGVDADVELTVRAGDAMKYDTTSLEAPTGAVIALTLEHTGTMPLETMGHNIVILRPGTDLDAFARAAASAKATGYIPGSKREQIVAHTRMLGGGESDTVVFTAPEPGTYPFICSFPGHYVGMRGELVVR